MTSNSIPKWASDSKTFLALQVIGIFFSYSECRRLLARSLAQIMIGKNWEEEKQKSNYI